MVLKDQDILKVIQRDAGNLFEVESKDYDTEQSLENRIKFILNLYTLWIHNNQQQRHKDLNHGLALRDIIGERLSASYDYNCFLTDNRVISGLKRDFIGDHEDGCDIATCSVIGRNERNRSFYAKNDVLRNQMYFIESGQSTGDETVDDIDIAQNIATQQILDSLHSYVFHTVHLNEDEMKQIDDDQDDDDEMEQDIDFKTLCDDHSAEKLVKMMESKRNSSNRFRSRQRGNTNEQQQHSENQKFVTTNDFNSASNSSFSSVLNKKRQRSFRDVFESEMKRIGISDGAMHSIYNLMEEQEFDTDAVAGDIEGSEDSTLIKLIADEDGNHLLLFRDMARRMVLERSLKSSLYSPGVRYFYWELYRGNTAPRRVVWEGKRKNYEENIGYSLGDWFVEKKYGNLKEELLNNLVHTLSASQFAVTLRKATDKLNERRKRGKVLRCNDSCWEESYGIAKSEEITIEHVVAILLYTNYSDLCYLFSATYRKIHEYEEDEDMLLRHTEYGIWGRLLREAVECFGIGTGDGHIKTFFHGVSSTLIFDSTSIRLCGPVSTTSSMMLYLCSHFLSVISVIKYTRNRTGFHVASTRA